MGTNASSHLALDGSKEGAAPSLIPPHLNSPHARRAVKAAKRRSAEKEKKTKKKKTTRGFSSIGSSSSTSVRRKEEEKGSESRSAAGWYESNIVNRIQDAGDVDTHVRRSFPLLFSDHIFLESEETSKNAKTQRKKCSRPSKENHGSSTSSMSTSSAAAPPQAPKGASSLSTIKGFYDDDSSSGNAKKNTKHEKARIASLAASPRLLDPNDIEWDFTSSALNASFSAFNKHQHRSHHHRHHRGGDAAAAAAADHSSDFAIRKKRVDTDPATTLRAPQRSISSASASSASSICAGARPRQSESAPRKKMGSAKASRGMCAPFTFSGVPTPSRSVSTGSTVSSSGEELSLFDVIGGRPLPYQRRVDNLMQFFETHSDDLVGWEETRAAFTRCDILGAMERIVPFLSTLMDDTEAYSRSMRRRALGKLVNVKLDQLTMAEAHYLYAISREARLTMYALSSQRLWNQFQSVFHLVSIAYTVLLPPFDASSFENDKKMFTAAPLQSASTTEPLRFEKMAMTNGGILRPVPLARADERESGEVLRSDLWSPLLLPDCVVEESDLGEHSVSEGHDDEGARRPDSQAGDHDANAFIETFEVSIPEMQQNLNRFMDQCSLIMPGGHALQNKPVTPSILRSVKTIRRQLLREFYNFLMSNKLFSDGLACLNAARKVIELDFLSLSLDDAVAAKKALDGLLNASNGVPDSAADMVCVHGCVMCLHDLVSILCMLLRVDGLRPNFSMKTAPSSLPSTVEDAAPSAHTLPWLPEGMIEKFQQSHGSRKQKSGVDDIYDHHSGLAHASSKENAAEVCLSEKYNAALSEYVNLIEEIASSGSVEDTQLMRWWIFRKQNGISDSDHKYALATLGWTEDDFERSLHAREGRGPNFCLLDPTEGNSSPSPPPRTSREIPISPISRGKMLTRSTSSSVIC